MNEKLEMAKNSLYNANEIKDIKENPVVESVLLAPIKAIPVFGDLIDSSTNKLLNDFQQKKEQELLDVILQDDCCAFEALVQKYGESVELSPVLIFSVPEVRSLFFYF